MPTQLPQSFYDAIDAKDVDRAFKLWTQEFERILFPNCRRIADTAIVYRGTAKRRQICFHEQRAHPKIIRQQASTLQTRKIWQAYCQLKEILVAVPGIRRERTIKNLEQVKPWLPESHVTTFSKLVESHNFREALAVIDRALEEAQRNDRSQRILLCWKRDMRSDPKKPFSYLRAKAASTPVKVSTVDNQ